jgi:hypothetical protein
MDRVEFEGMLVRVVSLGCAENVDWLFEHHGDVGVSKSALDDAVDMAICQGHVEVARTLQARGPALVRETFDDRGLAGAGGRTIVCGDDIARGEQPLEPPRPAVSSPGVIRYGRQVL